jgi:hypothetical protein
MSSPTGRGETTDLSELTGSGLPLEEPTPLWYCVLKEADSYLQQAGWRPTLPTRGRQVTGDFRMVDFLTFAGVDPTRPGQ